MTTNQALWQRRWDSLDNTIAALQTQYESFTNESSTRRENTIFELLIQLQKFGAEQFRFFHDGFYTKRYVDLAPIPDERDFIFPHYITGYSIEQHVLYHTLNQIAADMDVIQRASQQRLLVEETPQLSLSSAPVAKPFRLTLVNVDKLALTALRMFHGYLENKNQTALTYFRRSANVRVIPYAPVALIGIPVTVAGVGTGSGVVEDLLAIPHEVAHHLYWNGRVASGRRIHAELATNLAHSPVSHWVEEVFADVIGCLIGGPAVARSFIELQLTSIAAEFVAATNHHPMPALRPLLYAYTLETMDFPNSAAEVRNTWQAHLNTRQIFVNRELLYTGYALVDEILAVMDKEIPHWLRWSADVAYDTLYANFESRIPELVNTVPDTVLDPENLNIQTSWRDLVHELSPALDLGNLPEHWTDVDADSAANGDAIHVNAATWLHVYDAGGWITAGPGGGNVSWD